MLNRWSERIAVERLIATLLLLVVTAGNAQAIEDPDTDVARRHYEAGAKWYAQGQYEAALREFEAGLRALPRPSFHYNIALCHDRLEHYEEAIAAYQAYVDAGGRGDVERVKARIVELKKRKEALERARRTLEPGLLSPGPDPGALVPVAPAVRRTTPEDDGLLTLPLYEPPAPKSAWRRWGRWVVVGAAAALVAGSVAGVIVALPRDVDHLPDSPTLVFSLGSW